MANFSGIYRHYEGTDVQCSGNQLQREITWVTDVGISGSFRYVDCKKNIFYIGTHIDDLYNVTLTAPSSGEVLTYNGSKWINSTYISGLWSLNGSGAYYNSGNVGIGLTDPDTKLEVLSPNTQAKFSYNASNYITIEALSNGNGRIQSTSGDIYSIPWTRYDSTISGWSNFSNVGAFVGSKVTEYKTFGKIVYIRYAIAGSGNADETSFSLPFISENSYINQAGLAGDRTGPGHNPLSDPLAITISGDTRVVISPQSAYINGGEVYGDTVYKWLCGQFWYQMR